MYNRRLRGRNTFANSIFVFSHEYQVPTYPFDVATLDLQGHYCFRLYIPIYTMT